jgi:hypothetical protein
MRNRCTLLAIVCLPIILLALFGTARIVRQGRANISARGHFFDVDATIDLGSVKADQVLQVPIRIINKGQVARKIGQFTTDCTCIHIYELRGSAKVDLVELTFEPFETRTIYMDLMVSGNHGQKQATSIGFKDISGDDLDSPHYATNILFVATTALFTVPQNVDLGVVALGARVRKRLEVRSNGSYEGSIKKLSPAHVGAGIHVEIHDATDEARREFTKVMGGQQLVGYIDLTVGPVEVLGVNSGEVVVTLEGERVLEIPVHWRVLSEYIGLASEIVLPRLSNGAAQYIATVRCRSRSGSPVQITPRHVPELLRVVVRKSEPGDGTEAVAEIEYMGKRDITEPIMDRITLSVLGETGPSEHVIKVTILPKP